ncbi:beta-1,3-galactosyltransferase 4-like [Protobothrops mucrosquamatus]|uniref:beta-1,3-galactosyltransferase 4-like n=1 Tax=Protobothrops mucrosquamatus TaxID=103944 RepID=UPI0007757B98|nr:beta-1,3-galactosyltransferase 4-like [Protobothrops mucrosquamatus]
MQEASGPEGTDPGEEEEEEETPLVSLSCWGTLHKVLQELPGPPILVASGAVLMGAQGRQAGPRAAPAAVHVTAMLPCRKRCLCRSAQVLVGLLCSLATLLVLGFLTGSHHEELLSRSLPFWMGDIVGQQHIGNLLLPPPNAFPLSPSPCTLTDPWLLVLVASAPGHAARRAVVRQSWAVARVAAGHRVRTVFMLGLPGDEAQQAALEHEAAEYSDLLQARFADTYANLTLKTLAMLGWAVAHCPAAHFLVKADDDVFLNLPALARRLDQLASLPAAYLGQVYSNVAPIRNPQSRHYVPTSLYLEPTFPPYCSGTAYVLSAPAAAAVLGAAHQLPLLPVEDVFVALCARHAGIAPRHVDHFSGASHYPLDACCYREVLFSVHEVAPAEMLAMWEASEHLCTTWQRFLGLARCKVLAWLAMEDNP